MNSIGRLKDCEIIMKEKTPLSREVIVCFQMLEFETSKSNSEVSKSNSNILVRNNFFLENDVTSEGAVSHNVLYYQHLSIARYQVSFMLIIILSNYKMCPVALSFTQLQLHLATVSNNKLHSSLYI